MSKTTYSTHYSTTGAKLYLAFELGNQEWKLGFSVGLGQSPRRRRIDAGDLAALEWEIGRAKQRFGLPETVPVMSCYEAGRDGFPGLSGQDGLAASLSSQRGD
jgi:transposase